jgi:hypothetical protein
LISFYVEEYNSVIPHAAFAGQTPDEMYFGRCEQVPVNLAVARARAREARLKANRNLSCRSCKSTFGAPPDVPDSRPVPKKSARTHARCFSVIEVEQSTESFASNDCASTSCMLGVASYQSILQPLMVL